MRRKVGVELQESLTGSTNKIYQKNIYIYHKIISHDLASVIDQNLVTVKVNYEIICSFSLNKKGEFINQNSKRPWNL